MTRHILCFTLLLPGALHAADKSTTNTPAAIPWNQIGAKAGADYKGDGLTVTPTATGAQLHCVFQRLDAEATPEGLWLTSTVANSTPDRFRVTATAIGRTPERGSATRSSNQSPDPAPIFSNRDEDISTSLSPSWVWPPPLSEALPSTGQVTINTQTVRFTRPGLTEEYTTTMDGLRQDFIIEQPPNTTTDDNSPSPRGEGGRRPGEGDRDNRKPKSPSETLARTELIVQLSITGARVEPAPDGARLVLQNSGRKIAYTRLRVTDATGKELQAHIEVPSEAVAADVRRRTNTVGDEVTSLKSPDLFDDTFANISPLGISSPDTQPPIPNPESRISNLLSIIIDDSSAQYPLRIDPTFSDADWSAMGSGMNNYVFALAVSGNTLYAGGIFTNAGGNAANYIAQWNGTGWLPVGSGVNNQVYALAVSGTTLYVGGDFTTAGGIAATGIAQWNGTNWSAVGSGIDYVRALAISDTTLYAVNGEGVAQWDGTNWSSLGSGMNGGVNALAVCGTTLYAAGGFSMASGTSVQNIAQWNGTNWSALGSGLNNVVSALAVSGNTLYAGGSFTAAGGSTANYVAQWNGTNWSTLGSGMNSVVGALAASGSMLYAGGTFTNAGGIAANCLAQWNGSSWSALGSGVNIGVHALAMSGSTLYAGGQFTTAGGDAANYVAEWKGNSWAPVGLGMSNTVNVLAVSGGTLYAGGSFTTAGSNTANYIAQWNGTNWSQLGSGLGEQVSALAVSGNTLYAASGRNVMQWNGTNWSALGSGMNNNVYALAVSGSTLYAGGNFITAGGATVHYIAQWNGTNWTALGSGVLGGDDEFGTSVGALTVSGSTLYAGGAFTIAGGVAATNVAQWNGSSWSAVGSGLNVSCCNPYVGALVMSGGTLYAGGDFAMTGSNTVNCIAQWNGTNWSALGSGMNATVATLAVSGNTLFAGGNFTNAGGTATSHVAQWNGTNWSALGTGMNNTVITLAVSGNILYAGGYFTTADGNLCDYIAQGILPSTVAILTTDGNFGFTNGYFGFDISGPPGSNVVIQTSTDLQTWLPLQTNTLNPSGLFYFSDTQSPANTQRFYNVVLP